MTSSEIRREALTVSDSCSRRSCLVFTSLTSALDTFFSGNGMHYISLRFLLLTYLLVVQEIEVVGLGISQETDEAG